MVRVWGILVLIIDVMAIIDVWQREPDMQKKILWTIVILLIPLFGALAWYAISRGIINL